MTFLLKLILFFIISYWVFKKVSKWLLIRLLKSHPLFKQFQNAQQHQRGQQTHQESYRSKSGDVEMNVKKEGKKKDDFSGGEYIDYEEM